MNPHNVVDPALFPTRWIAPTFSAPIFPFCSPASRPYLYGQRRTQQRLSLSRFSLSHAASGLWVLEFTIVRLRLDVRVSNSSHFVTQVIWVIGASMVNSSQASTSPSTAMGAMGLVMIAGHNLLDGINAADSAGSWIWTFLHQPALLKLSEKPRASMLSTHLFRGSASWRRAGRQALVLAQCECASGGRFLALVRCLRPPLSLLRAQQSLW